jgi:glycosyltransferase involved in cell wall biosynthesis
MCDAFAGAGIDVRFLHPNNRGPMDSISWSTVSEYYDLANRFGIKTVSSIGQSSTDASLVTTLSITGSLTARLALDCLTGRIDESDIVYGRDYYGMFLFNEFRKLLPDHRQPTVVFEHHDTISGHFKNRFFNTIDHCICLSEALRDRNYLCFGEDPNRYSVAHHGVDMAPYQGLDERSARERLDIPIEETVIMYTGQLYPRKGVETLVTAGQELDAIVYVVGGYEEDIDRIKCTQDVPENVVFTGFIEPSEIPSYQVAADILVAPYTTDDLELNSPLKIFEYLAAGKPIVASDRETVREILTDGENALLFQPGSTDALHDCLDHLLRDTEAATRLQSGASSMADKFSYEQRAKRVLEIIR